MSPRDRDAIERARAFLDAHGADLEQGRSKDLGHYLEAADDREARVVSEIWQALHGAADETARLRPDGVLHQALARVRALKGDPQSLGSIVEQALRPAGEGARGAIPGYELHEQVGRGGQGRVYRAVDRRNGREVAIKLLPPAASADELERLRREGAIAAKLDDPCICRAYEVGECERGAFVVMEFVRGESLARRIAASDGGGVDLRPDPATGDRHRRLFEFLAQAAHAIARMHASGVLHRDIKPANVIVAEDGRPVILDFGLARAETDETLTLTGDFFGTVDYMAPELLGSSSTVHDERTEVWSLGVVLYECLFGVRPFTAATRAGTAEAVRQARLPGERLAAVPRNVRAVVETALDPRPDRRYRDAAAFGEDLERLARGAPVAARPLGRIGRATRLARRHPAVTLAVVLMIALPIVWALEAAAGERRATRYLSDVLATVESLLVQLASVDLDAMPRGSALRQRLLEEASQRYERLAADDLLGDEVDLQLARVELELARLASEEARLDQAGDRIASARRRLDRVAADRAGDPELRRITATADRRQAALLLQTGQHEQALALLENARSLLAAPANADGADRIDLELQFADALRRCGELERARSTLDGIVAAADATKPAGAAAVAIASLCLVQVHRLRGDTAAASAAQRVAKRAVIDALIEVPGNRHLLGILCLHELYDVDERRAVPDYTLVDASMTRAETVLRELAAQFPHWRQLDLLRWQYFARGVEIHTATNAHERLGDLLESVVADLDAAGDSAASSRRMAVGACAMLTRIEAAMAGYGLHRPELTAHLARLLERLRQTGPLPDAAALAAEADWGCVTQLFERGEVEADAGGAASRPSAALARAVSSGLRELGGKLLGKRQLDAALEHYETAYSLMKGAAARDPSTLTRRFLLFPTSRRAIVLMMLGRWEEAIVFLEEALPLFLDDAAVRSPAGLARFWIEYGPERRSELMTDERSPVPAGIRMRFARLLAQAITFLDADARMNETDRRQLRDGYVQRGRELVALAAASGYDIRALPEDRELCRILGID